MPSVIDARMKSSEAATSTSPPTTFAGKEGESIQINSGTQKMRLIVMELGRFTGVCYPCIMH